MDSTKLKQIEQAEHDKYTELYRNGYRVDANQHRLRYQYRLSAFLQQKIKPADKALEIGCGSGAAVLHLLVNGYNVMGVDITLERVIGNQGRFVEAPVWDMPFDDNKFDCTFSADVLEHVPSVLVGSAINEIFRVTGKLTIHAICTKPSPQGKYLHPTVKPIIWWKEMFEQHNENNIKVIVIDCGEFFVMNSKSAGGFDEEN